MIHLDKYIDERKRKVDAFLESHFRIEDSRFARLFEAMSYSLLAGGKRVRPVLLFAALEACGKEINEAAIRVASSIEMIHTYSLIHDDLPAMDNDDLRRGRPTNHKAFGEAIAILAGDSLLTESFEVIARSSGVSAEILLDVAGDIARASGGRGMAGGQALDLENEHRKISPAELETLHRHKTGCLIEVSITSGAKLAAASAKQFAAMKIYGEAIGLAFQIADDILDVEGGAEEMGKATGGDARKEKATYPSIIGIAESKRMAKELVQKSIDALESFGAPADPLRAIARYIVDRKS
jgi:geranylgeranyl diphosphate synthase type II